MGPPIPEPPSNLRDWLCTCARPLPESNWVTKLRTVTWDSQEAGFTLRDIRDRRLGEEGQRAQIEVPDKCLVMNGSEMEFRKFKVNDAFVRAEYFKISDRVVTLAREVKYETASEIEMEDIVTGDAPILDHIPNNPFNSMGRTYPRAIIVTGSPGNGKSIFLHLLLRLRLNARLPTLLQVLPESAVLVTEYGAHQLEEATLRDGSAPEYLGRCVPDLWCLVDSNRHMETPSSFVNLIRCTILQTPSPRSTRMDWVKKTSFRVFKLCMAPFPVREAIIARQFQLMMTPSERELEYWYQHFTPSFRTALTYGATPHFYEQEIKKELQKVHDPATLGALGNGVESTALPLHEKMPYEIFLYFPRKGRLFLFSKVIIPTDHLVSLIIDRFKATNTAKRLDLYNIWLGIGPLAAATERLMEDLVKDDLPKGGVYPLKKLQMKEERVGCHWTLPRGYSSTPDCYLVVSGSAKHTVSVQTKKPQSVRGPVETKFYNDLESDVRADGAFYFPVSATVPRFGFLHVQDCKAVLFQCTVSEKHNVKKAGLDRVIQLAKRLGIKEIIYIGVVPKSEEPTTFVIRKEAVHEFPNFAGQYLLPYEPVHEN